MAEILLEKQQEPARLRIYIGAAPGVGKTYHMLNDAHILRQQGVDLVIGLVETHGRKDTEDRIRDLEIVPQRVIPYRGVNLKEMDVDAIMARHPKYRGGGRAGAHQRSRKQEPQALRGCAGAAGRRHQRDDGGEYSAPGDAERRGEPVGQHDHPRDDSRQLFEARRRSGEHRHHGGRAALARLRRGRFTRRKRWSSRWPTFSARAT
jgi:hypothetical protein